MKNKEVRDEQEVDVPQKAADAWAEVYIDVSEKLDEEDRRKTQREPESEDDDVEPS